MIATGVLIILVGIFVIANANNFKEVFQGNVSFTALDTKPVVNSQGSKATSASGN